MKRRRSSCVALTCLLLIGCGGIKYGEVSGKVTHKGKALPGGTVTFWPQSAGGNPATADIEEDGSYSASVAVGEVAVTVETESLSGKLQTGIPGGIDKSGKQRPGGPPPEMMAQIKESMERTGSHPVQSERGNYVKIDAKYARPDTSGLKTTVQTGQQEFNIPLK